MGDVHEVGWIDNLGSGIAGERDVGVRHAQGFAVRPGQNIAAGMYQSGAYAGENDSTDAGFHVYFYSVVDPLLSRVREIAPL